MLCLSAAEDELPLQTTELLVQIVGDSLCTTVNQGPHARTGIVWVRTVCGWFMDSLGEGRAGEQAMFSLSCAVHIHFQ